MYSGCHVRTVVNIRMPQMRKMLPAESSESGKSGNRGFQGRTDGDSSLPSGPVRNDREKDDAGKIRTPSIRLDRTFVDKMASSPVSFLRLRAEHLWHPQRPAGCL